jgi:hypothetical protein
MTRRVTIQLRGRRAGRVMSGALRQSSIQLRRFNRVAARTLYFSRKRERFTVLWRKFQGNLKTLRRMFQFTRPSKSRPKQMMRFGDCHVSLGGVHAEFGTLLKVAQF